MIQNHVRLKMYQHNYTMMYRSLTLNKDCSETQVNAALLCSQLRCSEVRLMSLQSRRTDDPNEPDRSQSFSLSSRPGPGQMPQQDLPAPVRHLVKDPALQAMAAEAASKIADAVR